MTADKRQTKAENGAQMLAICQGARHGGALCRAPCGRKRERGQVVACWERSI